MSGATKGAFKKRFRVAHPSVAQMPGIRSNVNVRRHHSPGGASTGSTPADSIRSRRLAKAVNFANIMSTEEDLQRLPGPYDSY
ncbi:hypothetical protein AK812_SmicGene18636 [Symbiodinium microadriaticum]|uniref:Uncharacterized protein n=1 Tax=Symbiodinium microadriaticum TaxID=2951 RepID=A0A1Q9DUP1_SYMMI|nr:hypothetical protein AK812_SmicGene18636 [Symbiodinium microadriaticum]